MTVTDDVCVSRRGDPDEGDSFHEERNADAVDDPYPSLALAPLDLFQFGRSLSHAVPGTGYAPS